MSKVKPETSGDLDSFHPPGTTKAKLRDWIKWINQRWFLDLIQHRFCLIQSDEISKVAYIENIEQKEPSYKLFGTFFKKS